ncbi:MAG: hypothetical protein KDA89_17035 [Planctomycetaceae bacterium]|nr:hypothetical protein [Planctomycetaceae bacterium]
MPASILHTGKNLRRVIRGLFVVLLMPGEVSSQTLPSTAQSFDEIRPTAASQETLSSAATDRPSVSPSAIKSSAFGVLARDSVTEPFFSGAIPRSAAIANDASLNDVAAVGSFVMAVGERSVLVSSRDAGITWTTNLLPIDCSLTSVCLLTNQIGFVGGIAFDPTSRGTYGVVFRTNDGGNSWTRVLRDPTVPPPDGTGRLIGVVQDLPPIHSLRFFDLENAIAVCDVPETENGTGVFRTDDGGETWKPLTSGASASGQTQTFRHTGSFLSPTDGIIGGSGSSWAAVVGDQVVPLAAASATLRQVRGAAISREGNGWLVGDGGLLLRSDNGGVSWKPGAAIPSAMQSVLDFHTVAQKGNAVCTAGSPGSFVLVSEDGGTTWNLRELNHSAPVHRLCFVSESSVIAVGSLGIIHRSDDGGQSWQTVRNSEYRTGMLNIVTNPHDTPYEMLASVSGDQGYRSVTIQPSAVLSDGGRQDTDAKAALTAAGGNEFLSDWMFARTQPQQEIVQQELVAAWSRQTDNRLAEVLPQRLAEHIRIWRPDVICLHRSSDRDQVFEIWRQVIDRAVQIAAGDAAADSALNSALLKPWTVSRIVEQLPDGTTSALVFSPEELLTQCGTTSRLIADHSRRRLKGGAGVTSQTSASAGDTSRTVAFAVRSAAGVTSAPSQLFSGIDALPGSAARRANSDSVGFDRRQLKSILQTDETQRAALMGHLQLRDTPLSLISGLRTAGANLPPTLALQQLQDLAHRYDDLDNLEGQIAVLREIVDRFPQSPVAGDAAEILFQFYSSDELRMIRQAEQVSAENPEAGILQATARIPGVVGPLQPQFRPGQGSRLPKTNGTYSDAVSELWDANAESAFDFLETHAPARAAAPAILLRQAANVRRTNAFGESSAVLSEAAQGTDRFSLFAQAEQQAVHGAARSPIPVINLPEITLTAEPRTNTSAKTEAINGPAAATALPNTNAQEGLDSEDVAKSETSASSGRPYLDAALNEECWQTVPELHLLRADDPDPGDNPDCLIMLAWDREHLYISGRLERAPGHPDVADSAAPRHHDADHQALDRVEICLDTDRDYTTSFQFTIDETGQTSDLAWNSPTWNPKWYVAHDGEDDVWRFEAAIPFDQILTRPIRPGDLWSIRLRRVVPGVLEQTLQPPTDDAAGSRVDTGGTGLLRFIRSRR